MTNKSYDKNIYLTKNRKEQDNSFISVIDDIPNQRLINAIKEIEAIENKEVTPKKYNNFEEVIKEIN